MNKQLQRIVDIAQKESRLIVGLMSGTSLDGLDIALCCCSQSKVEVLKFKTIDYNEHLRSAIAAVQSKPEGNLEEVCRLNTELAHHYAEWVTETLKEWEISPEETDLIASHGQTIYHLPDETQTSTFQIIDGDHIAHKTGIITISDFRQKHTAAGGQGAPLAALMDEWLFRDQYRNRMLLNLGGIANFTWLPSLKSGGNVITSDTGPANTLINEAMQKYFNKAFDEGGKTAALGQVHRELLKYLLLEPYFRKSFPKTTGQESFSLTLVEEMMASYRIELSAEDLVATLTHLTVQSVTRAFDDVTRGGSFELFVSGGGIHNKVMMKELKERLVKAEIRSFRELGIHPDAKEAALMAFLADNLIKGNAFTIEGKLINLGKISLPD